MKIRLALAQLPGVRLAQWSETLEALGDIIHQAAERDAQLVLLPECAWPAYCVDSKRDYFNARASGLPSHEFFLERLSAWARELGLMICAGYIEHDGERLSNAACLIDSAGELLGTYRKCFLWDFDHDWFEPGDRIVPIDTAFGKIGIMICADNRLPEIPATLVARGAQLIVQPTAWVNVAGPGEELWNPQPAYLNAARAIEFRVPVAACSKWGTEGKTTFVGMSRIYDRNGTLVARLGPRETGLAVGEVSLAAPRPAHLTEHQRRVLLGDARCAAVPSDVGTADVRVERDAGDSIESVTVECDGHGVRLCESTSSPVACGKARVAAITSEDATGFAAMRVLALHGAHFVAVLGGGVPKPVAQARAAENRIFVAAGSHPVLAPSGLPVPAVTSQSDPGSGICYRMDLGEASLKAVARDTDTLAGRQPAHYNF